MDPAQPIEVRLPGGYWSDAGTFVERVLVRPIAGLDEEWLQWCPGHTPAGIVASGLLERCIAELDIASLPVGDRDYLLLRLRCMTLGDQFGLIVACHACGVSMDVAFAARDVPVEWRVQRKPRFRIGVTDARGSAHRLVVHIPTTSDVNAAIADRRPERALIAACVEAMDGRRPTRSELDHTLDRAARATLDSELGARAAGVSLGMRLACPSCGHAFDHDVELLPFLLEELRDAARHLWPEVHILALNYHWAEAEILRLPRQRRRWYVSLVNDSLREAEAR